MFIERGYRLQYAHVGLVLISGKKTNADGKGSGTYDFTSLLGNDKKQLLGELPGKILSVVQTSTSNTVKKIWEDFRELYTFIGSGQNSDKQITDFFEMAKS